MGAPEDESMYGPYYCRVPKVKMDIFHCNVSLPEATYKVGPGSTKKIRVMTPLFFGYNLSCL